MSPLHKLAVGGMVALTVTLSVVLGAVAGIGVWLVAVVAGGTIALLATLGVLASAQTSAQRPAARPKIDAATGLPDVEQLRTDLARAIEGPRHVLLSFPIDGLKSYNDAYGEQCGDALMAWLAAKLTNAVGDRAVVYRARGAAFAVLAAGREEAVDAVRADAHAALFEIGDGFAIWPSDGAVVLPEDAASPAEAIERADRRAHVPDDQCEPVAFGAPPEDPIDAVVSSRTTADVGELAKRVGRRLGVRDCRLDDLEAAAHLRDVGKVAIPNSILASPDKPSGRARRFIELHTIVGERVIAGRFGMEHVARLVRSSHERWDGLGYPDRLRGAQIPLESRIVCACAAYREHEALDELAGAAGAQFDPRVI